MSTPWPLVPLGQALNPVSRAEKVDASKEYSLLGVRLNGHGPFLREKKLGGQTAATSLYKVCDGDFIYSRLFAWRGAFGVIDARLSGCYVSGEFPVFRPVADKIDLRFMYYWFRLPRVLERVEADCTGSTPLTRNRFKEEFFTALEIPLPPLTEQRRIVVRIEELAAKIEEAKGLRQHAVRQTETLLSAERFHLFKKIADRRSSRFEDLILNTQLGLVRSVSQQSPEYGWPYLKMNNITSDGSLHLRDVTRVEASPNEVDKFSLSTGDFLFNTRNSYELVGKTAVWRDNAETFLFNNNIMRIRFRAGVDPDFVNEAFLSAVVGNQLLAVKKRTTSVCALYWKNLKEVIVPFPPLDEQIKAVEQLAALRSKVAALKKLQEETAKELDAMLPSVLDKAFKGEL